MTPLSLPHLGVFDFLAFRKPRENIEDKTSRQSKAPTVNVETNGSNEAPQYYIWSFFHF